MGGGGGHGGTTYKGFTLHQPKRWHVVTGKGLCAVMWFWILYRAKQDGAVFLGWRKPWDGHDDHFHEHEHNPEPTSGFLKPYPPSCNPFFLDISLEDPLNGE